MIIIDTLLKERADAGNPVRLGVFGAGFMGRGLVNQVVRYMPGLHVSILCNRTLSAAREALIDVGVPDDLITEAQSAAEAEAANGRPWSLVAAVP